MSFVDRRLAPPAVRAPCPPWVRTHVVSFTMDRLSPGHRVYWTVSSENGGTPVSGRFTPHKPRHTIEVDTTGLTRGMLTLKVRALGRVRRVQTYKIEPEGHLDNYLARASWEPELPVVQAFDTLIDQLVDADWWDRLDGIWACCADGLLPQTLNLKDDDGDFTLVPHNDPVRLPRVGWKGDNAGSAYLDTGYKVDGTYQFEQDAFTFGGMALDNLVESSRYLMGAGNGSDTARVGLRAYTGASIAVQASAISNATFRASSAVGVSSAGRRSADAGAIVRIFRDGLAPVARSIASTGTTAETLKLLTRRTDGGSDYSDQIVVFAFAGGEADDDAHHLALHDAINTFLLALSVITEVVSPEALPEGPNYMTRAMCANLTFELWHSDVGPASDAVTETNYSLFPLSGVYSGSKLLATTTWSGSKAHCMWDNGAKPERLRPNSLVNGGRVTTSAGLECRPDYSTPLLAMLSVEARVLWSRGATLSAVKDYLTANGWTGDVETDIIDLATVLADGTNGATNALIDSTFDTVVTPTGSQNLYPSYATTLDKVLLPEWKISGSAGTGDKWFMLDMEPGDGRSEEEAAAHYERLRVICDDDSHDGETYLLGGYIVTPVNRPNRGALDHGFGINSLWRIHAALDCLFLPCGYGNPEHTGHVPEMVANQIAMLKGPDGDKAIDHGKLGIYAIFGVAPARSSEQDMLDMHDQIVARGMRGAIAFPQRASFGGDITRPTTLNLWRLAFGDAVPGEVVALPGNMIIADFDAERSDLITLDGSNNVEAFVDAVDGVTFGQASSGLRPPWSETAFVGSPGATPRPGIVFNAAEYLELTGVPAAWPTGAVGSEIWVLADQLAPVAGSSGTFFGYGGAGGSVSRSVRVDVGTSPRRAYVVCGEGGPTLTSVEGTVDCVGPHILRGVFTPTSFHVEIDGAASSTPTPAVPTTSSLRARMGVTLAASPTTPLTAVVNRVLVTRLLDTDEAAALLAQLQARLV